jgi:hypothetical protein
MHEHPFLRWFVIIRGNNESRVGTRLSCFPCKIYRRGGTVASGSGNYIRFEQFRYFDREPDYVHPLVFAHGHVFTRSTARHQYFHSALDLSFD